MNDNNSGDSSPRIVNITENGSPSGGSSSSSSVLTGTPVSNHANNLVKLNIGGFKYFTTKQTLSPSHFFNGLISGGIGATIDDEGCYFVDRDGELFPPILSYLRTGTFTLPNNISFEKFYSEVDFYRIDALIKLLAQKKIYGGNSPAGGTLFVNKLPRPETNLKILNILSKANLLIIYYETNRIDIHIYKGYTFHWTKLCTIQTPVRCYKNINVNVIKNNNFNEISQILMCGSNEKAVISWKFTVDYTSVTIAEKFEKIYELKHYCKYLHYIANGLYLSCISNNGFISIIDLQEHSSKFLRINSQVTCIASDYELSLFLGCVDGKVYEIKQNLRDNFVWTLEECYKLDDTEFFQNTFGFSSKAFDKYLAIRDRNKPKEGNSPPSSPNSTPSPPISSAPSDVESLEQHSKGEALPNTNLSSQIISISLSTVPYGTSNTKTVIALGIRDGTIHLASKTNAIRSNDKFLFLSKFYMCELSHNPIPKVIVTGGKEGLFVSGLSSSGVSKTWYYNYENSMKSPVAQCVAVHSTSAISGGFNSFFDILKFKNYNNLHFHSNRNEKILYLKDHPQPSSAFKEFMETPQSNTLSLQTSSPPLSSKDSKKASNKYFTLKPSKHDKSKVDSQTFFDDSSLSAGGMKNFTPNLTNGGNNNNFPASFESLPKTSVYNQIYVKENIEPHQLLIYLNSNRNINVDDPKVDYQNPTIVPLIDRTPIRIILFSTFGGVEPNINDQSYLLLTVHESNEIYSWDLKIINQRFNLINPQPKKDIFLNFDQNFDD